MTDTTSPGVRAADALAPPCLLVLFGARGDLARRLVIPALYNLKRAGQLDERFAIVGFDHGVSSEAGWRRTIGAALRKQATSQGGEFQADGIDENTWRWLSKRMYYQRGDFTAAADYRALKSRLSELDGKHGTQGNVLFYLATAPRFFGAAVNELGRAGLVKQAGDGPWRRVIIEKPFGHDLDSARVLNAQVAQVLAEDQVFRIDHFLGKETVQNIQAFRFANGLFEPVWNRDRIDHVQITAAETIGVEGRGNFYEPTGALRDMVPNHLFQLLAMVAMEPPSEFTPAAMLRRRSEVIEAVRPLAPQDVVRGQYAAGTIGSDAVPAYRDEDTTSSTSETETYVAMKLAIDTWRWAGVPFYLRTGKRLRTRTTEVAIRFKPAPLAPFRNTAVGGYGPDWLVLHIQPDEGISLQFDVKRPGYPVALAPVRMDFRYRDWFPQENTVGYERLLHDCMRGEAALFQDAAMVDAAWCIVQPVLDAWARQPATEFPNYAAGSAGPVAADALLALDGGRTWRALTPGRTRPPHRPRQQGEAKAAAGKATSPEGTNATREAPRKVTGKASKATASKKTAAKRTTERNVRKRTTSST
ncbi:glucose-6-phosphate dehydrogenase [Pseudoxanthomonas sp.]|uniref:glucose-6-phosphate dehydrogenase n=1 Tax=Pseudoxanthomonas sp. TaxID=1871049 RepID=UPI00261CA3ED|nr:glucose-6-phosphate dehydrogenase [Pseudoxanthomonas sp.]WDS37234.1 MAG: glucose-6-phosphate dehydrogenase [Pseudoxanthomonas sp.]